MSFEKTGAIQPGVTPEVKPPEKRASAKKPTLKEKIQQLEDDAVARLIQKCARKK